jgi:hypothetical protein
MANNAASAKVTQKEMRQGIFVDKGMMDVTSVGEFYKAGFFGQGTQPVVTDF